MESGASWVVWLACEIRGSWGLRCAALLPAPGFRGALHDWRGDWLFFFFLVGLRDLKSGTHAYTAANPLSADPFPQLEVQLKIEKW